MNVLNITSLVASVVSVILGGFAIWLSVVFYKMSTTTTDQMKDASKSIQNSVERLEKLFDRLYSDTFAMMRDTYTDMRKHVWSDISTAPAEVAIESRVEQQLNALRQGLLQELTSMVNESDTKIKNVDHRIQELVNKAIDQTRTVEDQARAELDEARVEGFIVSILANKGTIDMINLFRELKENNLVQRPGPMLHAVRSLKEKGVVVSSDEDLSPKAEIKLVSNTDNRAS